MPAQQQPEVRHSIGIADEDFYLGPLFDRFGVQVTKYQATYPSQRVRGMPWDVAVTVGDRSAVGFGYTEREAMINALDVIGRP